MFRVVDASPAGLFDDFEVARRSAKPSPHSERAARSDFTAIHTPPPEPSAATTSRSTTLTPRALRLAFAGFAETHAAASIARAWSTWNQFFPFSSPRDLVAGNPMGAVAKPKIRRRTPKPLQGDDAPEQLLQTVAAGARAGPMAVAGTGPGLPRHQPLAGPAAVRTAVAQRRVDRRAARRTAHQSRRQRPQRTDRAHRRAAATDLFDAYLATRRERFPGVKLGPKAPAVRRPAG